MSTSTSNTQQITNNNHHSRDEPIQPSIGLINSNSTSTDPNITTVKLSSNSNNQINDDRSDIHNFHQFSFELLGENGNDSDFSSPEPSPTPIVSDLDELDLASLSIINIKSKKSIPITLIPSDLSHPSHGQSIPYISDNDDDGLSEVSMTPEPEHFDSPHTFQSDKIKFNYRDLPDIKYQSDDNDYSDLDYNDNDDDDDDDILPFASRPRLVSSQSWQAITMRSTQIRYNSSKHIKSITPTTQQMAVIEINKYSLRRRSVPFITSSTHKLFKLDPDLLQIRDGFIEKQKTKQNTNLNPNPNANDNTDPNQNQNQNTDPATENAQKSDKMQSNTPTIDQEQL